MREFSAEELQISERLFKNCSTSLATREMQIKTTLRYHLKPLIMAKIKNTDAMRAYSYEKIAQPMLERMGSKENTPPL